MTAKHFVWRTLFTGTIMTLTVLASPTSPRARHDDRAVSSGRRLRSLSGELSASD
jgi:hypothetical protein